MIKFLIFSLAIFSCLPSFSNESLKGNQQIIQELKLAASDGVENDDFGVSVSLDGNRALVGAIGKAYVYEFNENSWSETAIITPEKSQQSDFFGARVSLKANIAMISAVGDNGSRGAVYVYELTNNVWQQTQKFTSNDAQFLDQFGWSISLGDDRAVIGAHFNDALNEGDEGAAYIFEYQDNNWVQTAKLTANDAAINDQFGQSVSLYENRVVVGAHLKNDGITPQAGAVYVFVYDGEIWEQIDKLFLEQPKANNRFGLSVDIYKDWIVVGSLINPFIASDVNVGVVNVYKYLVSGNRWISEKFITLPESSSADLFGQSVSLWEDLLLVGAPTVDNDFVAMNTGMAILYDLSLPGPGVLRLENFTANDETRQSFLGTSVSLYGRRSLVGANGAIGEEINTGAAYSFEKINIFKNGFE